MVEPLDPTEHDQVMTALGGLDLVDRTALHLIYWHDLTQAEVALRLDLPTVTIRSAVARGMRQLSGRLSHTVLS